MNSEFNTNSNIPKLRFPEFNGEWEKKKLGELLSIGNGKDYKHLSSGDIPVFGTGGYMLSVDQYLCDGETVFIGRKGTINKPFYFKGKFWTVDTLFYTHKYRNLNVKFLSHKFNQINWLKYNEASGVPSLSKSTIEKLKFYFPTFSEQQKIASFLESVDSWIDNLKNQKESLDEYKKGMMQKIFTQEIRFKDENGKDFPDWEERKLGEVIKEEVQKTTKNNQHPVLSSTKNTICLQSDYFNKEIASSNNIGYKVLKRNQLVFSPQNIWLGNININTYYDIGIVSPSYKIYNIKENFVLVDYIRYIIKLPRMLFEYEISSEQGASVVRRNLNINLFHNIRLNLPSLPEQQKIASFLSSLDDQIQLKAQQIEKAEEWKKGLMQGLFV